MRPLRRERGQFFCFCVCAPAYLLCPHPHCLSLTRASSSSPFHPILSLLGSPAGDVSCRGSFRLRTQACTSRSFPLRASGLRPHHHIRTLTSPDRSFSSYLTLLPSASDRSPFTALSPPAFAALATITALPGKLHSLNCLDARPCSPDPYHLRLHVCRHHYPQ